MRAYTQRHREPYARDCFTYLLHRLTALVMPRISWHTCLYQSEKIQIAQYLKCTIRVID